MGGLPGEAELEVRRGGVGVQGAHGQLQAAVGLRPDHDTQVLLRVPQPLPEQQNIKELGDIRKIMYPVFYLHGPFRMCIIEKLKLSTWLRYTVLQVMIPSFRFKHCLIIHYFIYKIT